MKPSTGTSEGRSDPGGMRREYLCITAVKRRNELIRASGSPKQFLFPNCLKENDEMGI